MIKPSVIKFFRNNPNEDTAYPCGCGYVVSSFELRGNAGSCPNCGGDELGTRANPKISFADALEQEPLLISEEYTA